MDTGLDKWCEQLLDTNKGNRLVNFKDSKLRTIEILAPDSQAIFDKLVAGETLSFYDVDSYVSSVNNDSETRQNIKKQQVVDELSEKLKKNEILAFKQKFANNKVLSNIKNVANSFLIEKGINILYVAFGFLKWKEKEDDEEHFMSPLVLIPISLNNKSINSPFEISEYEDEVITNPTLLYKLKNEFKIELPEFRDSLHEDELLNSYYERVQKVVKSQGWVVKDSVFVGTFSFLKLNMYRDLCENEEKILSNITVRKLLNREVFEENNNVIDIDDYFKKGNEINLHNVVDADSSQMSAIIKAKAGKNLVLQGPPGTGKSQTITNLIAEFLYEGKKVLFVSEKLAALNVVFNNLKKAGLSDFCIELHSDKTNKKEFVGELNRVLNNNKKSLKSNARLEIEDLKKYKEQLDNYAITMHTVQPQLGKTPFEVLSIISKYNTVPSFEYVLESIEEKNDEFLKNATEKIEDFKQFSELIGYDYHQNIWHGYISQDLSYSTRLHLKKLLSSTLEYLQEYAQLAKLLSNQLGIELVTNSQVQDALNFLTTLSKLKFFDNSLFVKDKLDDLVSIITKYNDNSDELSACKKNVLNVYSEDIFENNLKDYYLRFKNNYISAFRFLNGNYRKDKKVLRQYQNNFGQKLKYSDIVNLLKDAKNVQQLEEIICQEKEDIFDLLKDKAKKNVNWKSVLQELCELQNEFYEVDLLGKIDEDGFRSLQKDILKFLSFINKTEKSRLQINELQKYFDINICQFNNMDFDILIDMLKNYIANFDELENWIRFNNLLINIEKLGLKDFIDKSIELNIPRDTLDISFTLNFYTQWMYYMVSENEVLRNFSRLSQDSAAINFKKKDKLKFEISKAEIIAKLTSEMPNPNNIASGSQISTLVREANKKSKLKPVRLLLKEIGQLIQILKPCFLMSPLSVSTYLDFDTCQFDVVIFDEASQIFPWDSIGAIYRGKQVIVVGDSKQMPPTNFFNANIVDDESEEDYEDDSLDFESILDLASTSFETTRLNWHYRSKTEDLIAFSNANFYDNSLVTFPSARKDCQDMGVDFYHVPNGVFNRKSKSNLIEAEKVVDLVFEHFKKYPNRSLGVVAFSISQQYQIEELIQKRRAIDDSFAEFFDAKRPEPFFVKNLETVQGDERDTIIFSVAYAKDSNGKFIHNFGPLNKKGGERRLNVAITRAKINVKLVSSIKSTDIDINRTESVGARLLKDYLYYAEHGMENINANRPTIYTSVEQDFINDVARVLEDAGYKVDSLIGHSEFKIDLGVKHPQKPNYVLAIECDGVGYRACKTTRDRDRLRQEVLERLGWKYYRVWSTDWFLNKKIEERKLLLAVSKAISAHDNTIEPNNGKNVAILAENKQLSNLTFVEEEKREQKDIKSLFKTYQSYEAKPNTKANFHNVVYNIVSTEAPITEELLLKKVTRLFGREKVTTSLRSEFYYNMQRVKDVYKIKDYYVVDKNMKIELRIPKDGDQPRDILLISNHELASGMLTIIKNNVGITKEGLFSTMTKLLGYLKQGNNITTKLTNSLTLLKCTDRVKDVNGELFLV